jgi:voltage-gated potassium channel
MKGLKSRLEHLYFGGSRDARIFRYVLLVFDLVTISFFIVTSMFPETLPILAIEYAIALVLILDFSARLWIARRKWNFLADPITMADIIVIGTLVLAPFIENWGFLRVLRALRLLRSYHLLRDLRSSSAWFKSNEQIIGSSLNLIVFIFFVTALVYVLEVDTESQINTYIDALYFTVTTLTTTGFGDITLQGTHGRLLAVLIMVVGVALFLRLVQTIFRPHKVRYPCPDCGLSRHDPDAVHCKHCGRTIHIETEGD